MLNLINDLYCYNDWANGRILDLCDGLTDEQLDAPRAMGFGSLRATLFHILFAEIAWLERWQGDPWREFQTDPDGKSVDQIRLELAEVAQNRRQFILKHSESQFSSVIKFQDSKKTPYEFQLRHLLLHVVNHGVHHRAQALNFLKQYDRTVVVGIDYSLYRLAKHAVEQTAGTVKALTGYGLAVGAKSEDGCEWDPETARRLFRYNDWATDKILEFANDVSDADLDRDQNMGPGSIRKTLLHLFDAEAWWVGNWTDGPHEFPVSSETTSLSDLSNRWSSLRERRDSLLDSVGESEAQRIVEVLAGGRPIRFRVGETIIHLGLHGTHHRAQLLNMLRSVDAPHGNIDLLYAISDLF